MIVSMIEFGKDFVIAAFDGRCVLIVAARQSGTFLIFARWADRDHAAVLNKSWASRWPVPVR
jgi:hypothetical protein